MKTVGAFEGKTHFSRLLAEAEAGETIIITKNGRPVARLEPIAPDSQALSADAAFAALLAMDKPLGVDIRTLIEDGRRV
jgi:prevent-host-death family protein